MCNFLKIFNWALKEQFTKTFLICLTKATVFNTTKQKTLFKKQIRKVKVGTVASLKIQSCFLVKLHSAFSKTTDSIRGDITARTVGIPAAARLMLTYASNV